MTSSPIPPCPSCPPHSAGGHGCAVYPSSVTDAEWATLEPLLPAPGSTAGRGGRPEKHCRRMIVDAILYIVRGGIAWRQLPMEFPPAGTVYAVFARWSHSYPGRLPVWAKDVLALPMQIVKRIPGATGFHVRPRVWVVERSFAWINKHRRCVPDYETRPDHHEAMVHIATIATMTRRLART